MLISSLESFEIRSLANLISSSITSFLALKNLSADLLNLSHNLLSNFLPADPAFFQSFFKSLNCFILISLSSPDIASTFAIKDSLALTTVCSSFLI